MAARNPGGLSTQVMLLLGVWCGYGVIDILFKQVAKAVPRLPVICWWRFVWPVS